MDNMRFYEKAREVPVEAQKGFDNGRFKGTDINPMWRIKKLTELFGPVGFGWYYTVLSERAETHGDTTIAIVDIELYVKDADGWSKPIFGTGGNYLLRKGAANDEGYKMALTDALSVACKALGIGANVYFANDKTKYDTAPQRAEAPQPEEPQKQDGYLVCQNCGNVIKPRYDKITKELKQSPEELAAITKARYGRQLCVKCARAEESE